MAVRNIRILGDDILTKKAKEVKSVNARTKKLIDDMLETMYEAQGVGLAAPQVGVLKRICVIDITEEGDSPIVLINPEITYTEGEQTDDEGCLSVPGKAGKVTRPMIVKVTAYDENMDKIEIDGEGLLARALAHEIDHLEGRMYVELAEGGIHDVKASEEDEEDSEQDEE